MINLPSRRTFYGLGIIFAVVFSFLHFSLVNAAINPQITFYGTLQDSSGNDLTGTYDMVFRFYDAASGGTLLDTSTHTAGNGNAVTVSNGEFTVVLGSGTGNTLDGLDFDTASIYVGLSVEGDSEMTPRERLTAAPYAFNSDTVDGYDAVQLLRYNATGSISASDTATLFSITQSGVGDIFNVFDGATEVFTIEDGGQVGIGTSTPGYDFVVDGDVEITGAIYDNNNSAGTAGYVLQSTGSGFSWVATSSLGITGGGSSLFTDGGATTYLTATGDNLGIGTTSVNAKLTVAGSINIAGAGTGIQFGGTKFIHASTSNDSISIGEQAGETLNSLTIYNAIFGYGAGRYASTTFADYNSYFGYQAGYSNRGGYNTISGYRAGFSNTGFYGVMHGYEAGFNNSVDNSILLGYQTGYSNSGTNIVALGYNAAYNNSGTYNVMLGDYAGYSNSNTFNNMFGYEAGYNNSGQENSMIGWQAGYNNSGSYGLYFGEFSGYSNSGNYNFMFGGESGASNAGSENIMIGYGAGYNNRGNNNIFLGDYTGQVSHGEDNIFIGADAGSYMEATSSVIVGAHAFRGYVSDPLDLSSNATLVSPKIYSAQNNTALGYRAGFSATTSADNNIIIGYQAADNLTTGAGNLVIGYDVDLVSPTGDGQLVIGNLIYGDGIDGTGTTISTGNIGIGTSTLAQKLTVSGNIRVGSSTGLGCVEDYDGTLIGGTCSSDESLKTNIVPLSESVDKDLLSGLVALTPVTYNWNEVAVERYSKNISVTNTGLIAQDVEEQFPELVMESGGVKQVKFSALIFYVIEGMKEMWEVVTGNQAKIAELEARLDKLENESSNKTDVKSSTEQNSNVSETDTVTDNNTSALDVESSNNGSSSTTGDDVIETDENSTTDTDSEDVDFESNTDDEGAVVTDIEPESEPEDDTETENNDETVADTEQESAEEEVAAEPAEVVVAEPEPTVTEEDNDTVTE